MIILFLLVLIIKVKIVIVSDFNLGIYVLFGMIF